MSLIFPQNIFTGLLYNGMDEKEKKDVLFQPSSLITKTMQESENNVGLIPTMDLLKNNKLFVSKKFGISFEGSLCNSYLYYKKDQVDIEDMYLYGDVSSVEVILTKILMKELYGKDIMVHILTDESKIDDQNLLLVGTRNFVDGKFLSGISFSEEIIETLNLPFVNYVLASNSEENLKFYADILLAKVSKVYDAASEEKFGAEFSDKVKHYLKTNISSLIMKFDEQDIEGITQLIRLPFFHKIVDNIIEIKFV